METSSNVDPLPPEAPCRPLLGMDDVEAWRQYLQLKSCGFGEMRLVLLSCPCVQFTHGERIRLYPREERALVRAQQGSGNIT